MDRKVIISIIAILFVALIVGLVAFSGSIQNESDGSNIQNANDDSLNNSPNENNSEKINVDALMSKYDSNGDDKLSQNEFNNWYMDNLPSGSKIKINSDGSASVGNDALILFGIYDTNGDGYLNKKELDRFIKDKL